MKIIHKLLIVGLLTLSVITGANAQYSSSDKIIGLGTGFGVTGNYYHSNNFNDFANDGWLPLTFTYTKGLDESSFAGEYSQYITLGAYANYHFQGFSLDLNNQLTGESYLAYKKWNTFIVGAIGYFHFSKLIPDDFMSFDKVKLDFYGSARIGIAAELYRSNFTTDPYALDVAQGAISVKSNRFLPNLGLSLGARYYITPKIGVYAEVGGGTYSMLNFGLNYKL